MADDLSPRSLYIVRLLNLSSQLAKRSDRPATGGSAIHGGRIFWLIGSLNRHSTAAKRRLPMERSATKSVCSPENEEALRSNIVVSFQC